MIEQARVIAITGEEIVAILERCPVGRRRMNWPNVWPSGIEHFLPRQLVGYSHTFRRAIEQPRDGSDNRASNLHGCCTLVWNDRARFVNRQC